MKMTRDMPCQTCGDYGWRELLLTCSRCRVARQHCYCIKEHSFQVPRDWVCIDCLRRPHQTDSSNEGSSSHGDSLLCVRVRGESSKPVPKWKVIPDSARVKLISPEEAVKLSSGLSSKGFPSGNVAKLSLSANSAVGFTRQTNAGLEAKRSKSATGILKLNPSSPQIKTVIPPRQFAQQIGARDTKQVIKAPEGIKGKRVIVPSIAVSSGWREQQAATEPAKRIGTSYNGIKNANDRTDHDLERCSSPLLRKLVEYQLFLPALYPTWKGGFLDSASPSEFYGGFRAHPPSVAHQKAYNFSQTIPLVLKFELLSAGCLLEELLKNENPDLSDIALYFFPDENIIRSRENNTRLFERMVNHNAVIRSNINGTDLLIFTSRLLDKTTQRIMEMQINTRNFLWGIFIRTENLSQTSPFNPVDVSKQHAIGMEIDTEGNNFFSSKQSAAFQITPTKSPNKIREDSVPPVDVSEQHAIGMEIDKEGDSCISSKETATFQDTPKKSANKIREESVPPGFETVRTISKSKNSYSPAFQVPPTKSPNKIREDSVHPSSETVPTISESKDSSSPAKVPERIIQECPTTPVSLTTAGVWTRPPNNWVKLNVQGISKPFTELSGAAGIVRDESGKWLYGFVLNLIKTPLLSAELWGLFQGLTFLWERGFRKVLVETTNTAALEALTTDSSSKPDSKNNLVKHCKEMIQREWECRISAICREQNACAVWLGDILEGHPTGLVLFTDPPRGLVPLLEKERLVSASSISPTYPLSSEKLKL